MSSVGIYIIDDSDELLQGYRHVFQPVGEVHAFPGPTEFLKHLEDNPTCRPDLVVTDLSMPEMNGLEMVKKAQEKGVFFPCILVSGYLNKEMAIQANEIGVWRILEKPVSGKSSFQPRMHWVCEFKEFLAHVTPSHRSPVAEPEFQEFGQRIHSIRRSLGFPQAWSESTHVFLTY